MHTQTFVGGVGLPPITLDLGAARPLTIQNGTIERVTDLGTPNFGLLWNEGHLILRNVTLRGGRTTHGGAVFSMFRLEVRDGSVIADNQ